MTKTPAWLLPFMFVITGADVVIIGYRFLHRYPLATWLACTLLLAALGGWYAVARRASDEGTSRTMRTLSLIMVVLVLAVPYLLGKVLGRP